MVVQTEQMSAFSAESVGLEAGVPGSVEGDPKRDAAAAVAAVEGNLARLGLRLRLRLRYREPTEGLRPRSLHPCVTPECRCLGVFYENFGGGQHALQLEIDLEDEGEEGLDEVALLARRALISHFSTRAPSVDLFYNGCGRNESVVYALPKDSTVEWVDGCGASEDERAGVAGGCWRVLSRPDKLTDESLAQFRVRFGGNVALTPGCEVRTKPAEWVLVEGLAEGWTSELVLETVRAAIVADRAAPERPGTRRRPSSSGATPDAEAEAWLASACVFGSDERSDAAFIRLRNRTHANAVIRGARTVLAGGAGRVSDETHRLLDPVRFSFLPSLNKARAANYLGSLPLPPAGHKATPAGPFVQREDGFLRMLPRGASSDGDHEAQAVAARAADAALGSARTGGAGRLAPLAPRPTPSLPRAGAKRRRRAARVAAAAAAAVAAAAAGEDGQSDNNNNDDDDDEYVDAEDLYVANDDDEEERDQYDEYEYGSRRHRGRGHTSGSSRRQRPHAASFSSTASAASSSAAAAFHTIASRHHPSSTSSSSSSRPMRESARRARASYLADFETADFEGDTTSHNNNYRDLDQGPAKRSRHAHSHSATAPEGWMPIVHLGSIGGFTGEALTSVLVAASKAADSERELHGMEPRRHHHHHHHHQRHGQNPTYETAYRPPHPASPINMDYDEDSNTPSALFSSASDALLLDQQPSYASSSAKLGGEPIVFPYSSSEPRLDNSILRPFSRGPGSRPPPLALDSLPRIPSHSNLLSPSPSADLLGGGPLPRVSSLGSVGQSTGMPWTTTHLPSSYPDFVSTPYGDHQHN